MWIIISHSETRDSWYYGPFPTKDRAMEAVLFYNFKNYEIINLIPLF